MTRIRTTLLAVSAAAAVALAALVPSAIANGGEATARKNIVETATAAGQFRTLTSLLQQSGLAHTLATGGPYTVFAPTDAAFAKVPASTLHALAANPAKLRAVLLYHVVDGRLTAGRLARRHSVTTLEGQSLRVRARGGRVHVGGARVTTANVLASNGVIHVINRVLIPR